MSYELFDFSGNPIEQVDLQNKSWWCKDGVTKEFAFVARYGERLGLSIHPDKASDPYGPDLLHVSGRPADLKTQNTPFFLARTKYNMDPQYAVTFNVKDADRYAEMYPNILIFFAVDWVAVKMICNDITRTVDPMSGVWAVRFENLKELLLDAPTHEYQQRVDDDNGNAKKSQILSLSEFRKAI